ncbi:hypothetical protein E4T80_12315 [Muribacter muris]|uniref:Uncharacterized protein n=1 Tax=Muribacter muris TaxID=67855 RepID=A0A4Y9JSE3_9PAST|nr:hypothetical protein [Muribacter muris]MBF0786248.1 hypothetical protein [Muribacter muris]MBF0827327.1 hypothetical protein [Muribacter muris]TFV07396.1 hypothetical protein E4T80_12315 [Muribacter muris]
MENKQNYLRGFSRDDSSLLGFIIWCEGIAITFNEFKEYFLFLIKENNINEIPDFIWDIIDMEENEKIHLYKRIIGFVPDSKLTEFEISAIYGIGLKRFGSLFDISKKKALDALEQNPHILERFKKTFPFIKLDF